jgi:DinB superfamily
MRRPADDEYGAFYGGYVARVPETDIVAALETQAASIDRWPARVAHDKETMAYAPGKWTVRQVVGHMSDAERVFSYRAMRISRGDATPLPGFEENAYVARSVFADVPLQMLVAELAALRRANLPLFRRIDEAGWSSKGEASGMGVTVRALAYIMVGHVRHHVAVLKERYGLTLE